MVIRRDARRTIEQPAQRQPAQQCSIEHLAGEQTGQQQIEATGLAKELARGQAKYGRRLDVADPAGGARLRWDSDLLHMTVCLAESFEDNVEWIGAGRTGGEEQINSFGGGPRASRCLGQYLGLTTHFRVQ